MARNRLDDDFIVWTFSCYNRTPLPLYEAVLSGDLKIVDSLLNEHSPEERFNCETLLHTAAAKGHDQIVDLLCQRNFSVNEMNRFGETPLHIAIKENQPSVFNLLLNKSDLNAKTYKQEVPLHFALRGHHIQLAEGLLQRGVNVNIQDSEGIAPLHLAVELNQIPLVEIILQNGSDVNVKDKFGNRPLHLAIKVENIQLIEILLKKGATVNVRDNNHETPLHIAENLNNIQIVELLLKNGAKVDEQENEKIYNAPLYYAAENMNMKMFKLLMSEYCTVETKHKACKAALNLAIYKDDFKTVKYLMEHVFEMSEMANFMSETQDQQLDLFEICDSSVDVFEYPCSLKSDGIIATSLHYHHLEIWQYLLNCSSKIDSKEYSQLHFAVQAGQVETVRKILKEANKVESDSLAARLAVYIAVENGNETILKILLEAGYSTKSCYKDRTPLHIAATFDHTRLVEILLEAGADINSKTSCDRTPLDFALAAGHSAVVKFFLEAGAYIKDFHRSLVNVLKRGSDRGVHWIITPFVFENLLKITEMLLIAGVDKIRFLSINSDNVFKYAMKIIVSRENEQNNSSSVMLKEETSNEKSANKLNGNSSNEEFRPEILWCLLNYIKYVDKYFFVCRMLYSVIHDCVKLNGHPSILDIILEQNDCSRLISSTSLFENYESSLLLIGYDEDVYRLTNAPIYIYDGTIEGTVASKLIVARLVLLPNKEEKKKLKFYDEYNLLDWRDECEQQLKCMKEIEVIDECKVTLYDILTHPVEKIAIYIRSKHLLETLESFYMKFPAYAKFLKMSVERGKRRKNLIDKCVDYIFQHIKINYKIHFSTLDIDTIFKYLSVNDLRNLAIAFI